MRAVRGPAKGNATTPGAAGAHEQRRAAQRHGAAVRRRRPTLRGRPKQQDPGRGSG